MATRSFFVTLNHDTLLEQSLRAGAIPCSDGFERRIAEEIDCWTNTYSMPVTVLKPHGSVNWYRLPIDGRQTHIRSDTADPYHLNDDDGNLLELVADARGQFLAGTFNKILAYAKPVYFEQQIHMYESLRDAQAIVVAGYGFGDKAINTRLLTALNDEPTRPVVLIHDDPDAAIANARPAMQATLQATHARGQLRIVPEWIQNASWSPVRTAMG